MVVTEFELIYRWSQQSGYLSHHQRRVVTIWDHLDKLEFVVRGTLNSIYAILVCRTSSTGALNVREAKRNV